jgi:hypothetical protein
MSESIDRGNQPPAYIERAISKNDDFLAELDAIDSLQDLQEALHELAFVTTINEMKCSILPEITSVPGSEDPNVKVHLEEDIVRSLGAIITDPVTDMTGLEQEVRNWIPHRDIANAVIRIITKTLNEQETT